MDQLVAGGRLYLTRVHLSGHTWMRITLTNVLTTEQHLTDAWTLIHDALDRTLVE